MIEYIIQFRNGNDWADSAGSPIMTDLGQAKAELKDRQRHAAAGTFRLWWRQGGVVEDTENDSHSN